MQELIMIIAMVIEAEGRREVRGPDDLAQHLCVYIYKYMERGRESVYLFIIVCVCVRTIYIYIYIYI